MAIPVPPHIVVSSMRWLPGGADLWPTTPAFAGMYAVVGVMLLVSAAFPHRWRARAGRP